MDQINKEQGEKKKDFSLDSDSEAEGDEVVGMEIDINFIDEKSSAVHCIGHICVFAMASVYEHLPTIMNELKELHKYFHENIRYHICLTYSQIAVGLAKLKMGEFENKLDWKKGLPIQVPLHPDVTQFLETVVFPHYVEIFEDEQHKEVIEKLLESYVDMAECLGPGAFSESHLEALVKYVGLLLEKKAFCQTGAKDFVGEVDDAEGGDFEDDKDAQADEEEEEDDDEDDIDHDELILGNTTDVIIQLSKLYGDQFTGILAQLAP